MAISSRNDGGPPNVGQTILSAPQASTGHLGREINQSQGPLSRSDSSTSRFGSNLQCEAMERSFQQRLTWLPCGSQKGRQDCLPHPSENVQSPGKGFALDIPASLVATVSAFPRAVGFSVSPRLASLSVATHAIRKREQNSLFIVHNGLGSFGDFAPNGWPLAGQQNSEVRSLQSEVFVDPENL